MKHLVAELRVAELTVDTVDPFPFGSTLCITPTLERCIADVVHYEGFLTFFEELSTEVAGMPLCTLNCPFFSFLWVCVCGNILGILIDCIISQGFGFAVVLYCQAIR